MNELTKNEELVSLHAGQALTSTLVIAQHTEHEHRAVLQLVRNYLDEFDSYGRVAFVMQPFETAGGIQTREVALLNEHQATLLVTYMRNRPLVRQFKRRLVHAFFEMAKRLQRPAIDPMQVLNDPAAMRGLLLTYSEKAIALEGQVAEMRPQVEAFERLAVAEGSLCIQSAAKHLQMRPSDLFRLLQEHQWIYRRAGGGGWLAYQGRIQRGYLEHKVTTVERSDGSTKITEQCRVTPKGLARLAQLLSGDKEAA